MLVSLNPDPSRMPDERQVIGSYHYSHPVFDAAAIAAQQTLPSVQGRSKTWFCGAWTRYGFHEDGLMSAQAVVQSMREAWAGKQQPHQEAA